MFVANAILVQASDVALQRSVSCLDPGEARTEWSQSHPAHACSPRVRPPLQFP